MRHVDASGHTTHYNPCIFTGALVVIEEYPAFIRCDVFLVGECIILTGYDEAHFVGKEFDLNDEKIDAYILATDALMKDLQKFIAIPAKMVRWTERGRGYANSNLAHDGMSL